MLLLFAVPALAVVDRDGDGFPAPADCDDDDAAIFPGAPEVCDQRDNDCDARVDDGFSTRWYADADGDGWGDERDLQGVVSCDVVPGRVLDHDDCDDDDPDANPGFVERCDGEDNDCSGAADDGLELVGLWYDGDGDGFGAGIERSGCWAGRDTWYVLDAETGVPTLAVGGYLADGTDCNDFDPGINPGASDVCNTVDDDCDGVVDSPAADGTVYHPDEDGDGVGGETASEPACAAPEGWVEEGGDCDDTDPDVIECVEPTHRSARKDGCGCAATGASSGWLLTALVLGLSFRRSAR